MEIPSYDSLLAALLNVPLQEVHKSCTLTPMLAKPRYQELTGCAQEVECVDDYLWCTCEYKYDVKSAQQVSNYYQYHLRFYASCTICHLQIMFSLSLIDIPHNTFFLIIIFC